MVLNFQLLNKIGFILLFIVSTSIFASEIKLQNNSVYAPYEDYCALKIQFNESSQKLYVIGVPNPRFPGHSCLDNEKWESFNFPKHFRGDNHYWSRENRYITCKIFEMSDSWFIQRCENKINGEVSNTDYYLL